MNFRWMKIHGKWYDKELEVEDGGDDYKSLQIKGDEMTWKRVDRSCLNLKMGRTERRQLE